MATETPTPETALIRFDGTGTTIRVGRFLLTPTGLEVDGTPTLDEWAPIGPLLKRIEGAVQFWWGDWHNYGEQHFGEAYSQVLEASGYEESTLRNCAYVARAIPSSRRRESVPFAIHQEVAPLPPAEQERWLEKAETEQLSRAQVRQAIRRERLQTPDPGRGLQPDGTLVAMADDGQVRLICKVVDGQVAISFDRPTRWIGLRVSDVHALVSLLEDRARTAETVEREREDVQ